jgi:hypothetical protein
LNNDINIFFNPIINKKITEKLNIQYNHPIKEFNISNKGNDVIFTSSFGNFEIKPNSSLELSSFESFLFDKEKTSCSFALTQDYIEENNQR